MSDEKTTQRKPKGHDSSWNPLRSVGFKKAQKETDECELQALRVDFEPDKKPPPTFVYSEEKSEVITPVSAHTLKLLEAIREDKLEFVEDELNSMNKQEIDRTDRHGFALIHVAARYNLHRIVNSLLKHGADVNIGTSEYRWTPLHLAARFNGLSAVEALLQGGADPSIKGKKGSTPLHFAARRGNDEIVKILLEHPKVNVNARDSSGKTALHVACSEGQISVCNLLLNKGADIKAVTADNTTPLHNAILNGHSQVATMILNRAADKDNNTYELKQLVDNKDLQDNTVLHMAALNNDVKTAELCLDHGADVNTRKSKETTPLHIAATKGNLEMAALLISRGAGVNMKDGDSKAPLHRAAQFNQTKLISLLVENGAKVNIHDGEGRSPFLNAVAAGQIDSARVLLKLGADVNATDLLMKTCLHIAVENEQLKMLAMLLESHHGTRNLYKADLWDRVPLHYAAKSKDIKILELVLSKQRHLSYRDENQKTPLHLAAESLISSSKHVEVLARRMPSVDERDEHGRTPLHSAARKGHRKACETLLKLGAEVDSKDNNSRTALMWSVKKDSLQCAKLLLDFKASVDLQDTDGDSALHVACGQGHAAMVRLLLDSGASLTLCNKRGNGCLEIAAKAGSSDVAMAIVKHKRWVELENYLTKTGQTPISLLVENFPDAAEVALNQCVHHSPHLNITDPEYTVTYDFKYLDLGPEVKQSSKRFSAVKTMIKHARERLLLHPLTLKFNERKWSTLGRFGFFADFVTYFLLLVLLSIFVVQQRGGVDLNPKNLSNMTTSGEAYKPNPSDVFKKDSAFAKSVPYIVLIFATLHICKEFFQIYMQRWKYFKDTSNYLDWILYISTTAFMAPYVTSLGILDERFSALTDPRNLWIFGVVAIFVCYSNMMLFLRRYRLFGTYISMYTEVIKTVIQVMVVFVFLVLGFALVFYVLFMEQDAFRTVPLSTLRVLVMTVGELDFTNFVELYKNHKPYSPFPTAAFTFLFLCLFLLSVGLMNLLVGLAVGDTEKMKKLATIKRLAMQIEYHIEIEESYPGFITRAVYEEVYADKPNQEHSIYQNVIAWLQARYAEAAPEPLAEDNKSTELTELREGIMKNKKRIKSVVNMLEAQNKLLRSLALSINPNFQLPEDIERASWTADGADDIDGRRKSTLERIEEQSEEPTDGTNVPLAKEENVFKDGL